MVDYKNDRPQVLKLEDYVPCKGYAFTVNPAEQYFGDLDRMKKVLNLMMAKMRSPYFEYDLYIEVSPSGRIHGHGWIWIHKPLEFVLFDVPHMHRFMNIKIDEINDPQIWEDYCTKQCHIVKRKLSRLLPKQSELLLKSQLDDYYGNSIVGDSDL